MTEIEPAPAAAAELFGEELDRAVQYAGLLGGRGVEWGLIGPRETGRLWDRHLLNSLAVSGFIPAEVTVVDVGSGGGLPGIPLALARPDLLITLLEPLERRARFLSLAVEELGLDDRVRVVRARAEDHPVRYHVATCRAVGSLSKLLEWTTPLFSPDGQLVALKGESADRELVAASRTLHRHRLSGQVIPVSVHPEVESTRVLLVR